MTLRLFAGALALLALSSRADASGTCIADCNDDAAVTVNELVTGVTIALGSAALDLCPAADCAREGAVSISCLVQAVNAALEGCVNVPTPSAIEGPITSGMGAPFVAGTTFDLAEVGYQQTEYFLTGTARAFRNVGELGTDGRWSAEPSGETAAYKTRVIVNRPIDPADFNGTVMIEWHNVSGGLDASPDWLLAHTELIREGYAFVGLSAQKVGIEGGTAAVGVISLPLKTVDPVRYASLSHPGDSFSYDILSQTAQAIRDRAGIAPLDELPVERIIAAGESQSAFRMVTYINAFHRLTRIFDGYLVHSRGAIGAPLSEAPLPVILVPGTTIVRDDLDVPTMIFQAETDLTFLNYLAARQPDTPSIRVWEAAGTAHADLYTLSKGAVDRGDDPDIAKLTVTAEPIPGIINCGAPVNDGPQHFVLKAAIHALERWVRDGTAPAIAPPLEVSAGPPAAIVRDARGIALGGIRTPAVDVPLAVLSGDAQPGSLICALFGITVPFDEATLMALYADQAAYADAVEASADAAVAAGFLLPPDAALIKAAAADTAIP